MSLDYIHSQKKKNAQDTAQKEALSHKALEPKCTAGEDDVDLMMAKTWKWRIEGLKKMDQIESVTINLVLYPD